MKKLFLIIFLAHLLSSCSKVNTAASSATNGVISSQDHKQLLEREKQELSGQKKKKADKNGIIPADPNNSMIAFVNPNAMFQLEQQIKEQGGRIIFQDEKTGYINFSLSSTATLKLLEQGAFSKLALDKEQEVELKLNVETDPNGEVKGAISRSETPKDLYPTHLMKVDKLKEEFKAEHGKELDGSSATVVIADTGLDISRTDAFQDRIVELHTLRQSDHALLFEAVEKEIDGKTYLTATYNGVEIKIEKTKRLEEFSEAYVGFFTEGQFKNPRGYNNFDFNQDGNPNAIYPVVVGRKDSAEPYQAYINVNSSMTYGPYGDDSIEDENLLLDFNMVARNIKDRFVKNEQNPLKSYYRFTTRMDIIAGNHLTTDRNKGVMNVAITLGLGNELDETGALRSVGQIANGQKVYMMGLVGFDIMGHGTHCAGIATGSFDTAKEFSSAAPKAKLIGVTYLGSAVKEAVFYNQLIQISQRHKNVVYSFSFGGNTPINDTQSESAQVFDRIAEVYGSAFVKAAGNEGPGLNTHGITISKNMIAVANYYSTTSRATYSYGNFDEGQFFLESSSSRGPMIDGALKPDIGAPGWVMSSVPLARALGSEHNGSFQYWPGTSMATPNVAGVVALLFDAAEKAGIANEQGPAVSVDKIQRSLWNSALPYSPIRKAECRAKQDGSLATHCRLKETAHNIQWVEGGAGRVNALGAWEVLQQLVGEPAEFYTVSTKSPLNNYRKKAAGYFNIISDEIPKNIDFEISLDSLAGAEDLDSLAQHQKLRLQIPADVDWLSFDVNEQKNERLIDVFGGETTHLRVFVNRQKLMKNGRMKGGLHAAVIKGFSLDNSDIFRMTIPVTMIGYDTQFDANLDNYQLSARGFIQGAQFARYFVPIKSENEALVIDLGVDGAMPGDVSLAVFHDGMQITDNPMWTLSNPLYGQGRNNTHFVLKGKPGLYEIIIKSDAGAHFSYKNLTGSFYNLTVSRMVLTAAEVAKVETDDNIEVTLEDIMNPGGTIRIAAAEVVAKSLVKNGTTDVGNHEDIDIPVTLEEGLDGLEISTRYLGSVDKVDIDISLLDANGKVVAASGNPDATELMSAKLAPGQYTFRINGYSVPGGEKVQIDYKIKKSIAQPTTLASEFKGPADLGLGAKKRIYHNQRFTAKASFAKSELDNIIKVDGFTPVLSVEVSALTGNGPADVTTVMSVEL